MNDEFAGDFDYYTRLIGRYRSLEGAQMLEIGAGVGWFEVFCELHGLDCEGIDHHPDNIAAAMALGREHGVTPRVQLADATAFDYGRERWDVIFATSLFEHIRDPFPLLARVYDALTPGGAFFFYSTNKWSLRSGEYPDFPLYGWWPYAVRERIRVRVHTPSIVTGAGIDFNQFTYWGLRRDFRRLGYTRILDRVDLLEPDELRESRSGKQLAVRAVKAMPPLTALARAFAGGNTFLCVK
jgi:SAM-dependent methyltransferase